MDAMNRFDQIEAAAARVRSALGAVPETAVVLGSGLGAFADSLSDATSVPYSEVPGWPASRVVGHAGTLVAGTRKAAASWRSPGGRTSTRGIRSTS